MRILLLAAALCLAGAANATNYYFSSVSGDDARTSAQAQNPATPWKSLAKLNSFFSSLAAGDSVLFKSGETFYGSITVGKGGASGRNIIIATYGGTAKPVISGFVSVGAWTSLGSNIWESTAAVSTLSSCNVISINGVSYAQGRTPDTGYWTIASTNGSTTITDATHLNATTTNWSGAQVVVRELMYELNKHNITSASGNTITFDAGSIPASWGYFIQNDVRACNLQNEWAYNSTTKKVSIYSTTSPVNVQVPTIEEAVTLNSKDYISFTNLSFKGFNTTGINTTSRTGIKIQNCDFSFIGTNAVYAYPNSNNLQVTGSTFTDCGSRAIHGGSSSNAVFSNNTLLRIGHFAGMGSNGDDSYTGIISNGDNSQVSYNTISNVGYCGIRWDGNSTIIKGNFVNTTTYIKDDGGGIYCYPVQFGSTPHTQVTRTLRDNIVLNPVGAPDGSPYGKQAMGIYMDGQSPNINVVHNTVSGGFLGIFINGGHDIYCDSNTTYNSTYGIYLTKIGGPIDNETVTHNVFVARDASQASANYKPAAAAMPDNFTANDNYYARPMDDTKTIWQEVSGSYVNRTLAEWKTVTGEDGNSQKSPKTITSVYDLRFVYNETGQTKTINLGATYVDVRSASYPGSITLTPYSSAVLIKNDATNIPPVADAGVDQTIALPVAITLSGSGLDYDGTISTYTWTKVSGGTATITSTSSAATTVTGLTTGTYKFELKVTDNKGATGRDTVTVNFGNIITPVTLAEFKGYARQDKTTQLQWKTVTEINSDYFVVERSTDGANFTQVAIVNAQDNSNTIINYQMIDNFPNDGINYYRLKMVDNDGTFQYSNTITVNFKSTFRGGVAIVSTVSYNNRFEISISSPKEQDAVYAIYDAAGRVIYTSTIKLQEGLNGINKNMVLSDAMYYFKIATADEKASTPFVSRK